MHYNSEDLVSGIRQAREAAGISQRALRDRSGLTQSHISQIESGKLEPGLSTFIDMARALGLELLLVPKKLVPAVEGMVRGEGPAGAVGDRATPRPAYSLDAEEDDA